jgi:hypothetical protein
MFAFYDLAIPLQFLQIVFYVNNVEIVYGCQSQIFNFSFVEFEKINILFEKREREM